MKYAELGRQLQIAMEHLRRARHEAWDDEDESVVYFANEVNQLTALMVAEQRRRTNTLFEAIVAGQFA